MRKDGGVNVESPNSLSLRMGGTYPFLHPWESPMVLEVIEMGEWSGLLLPPKLLGRTDLSTLGGLRFRGVE